VARRVSSLAARAGLVAGLVAAAGFAGLVAVGVHFALAALAAGVAAGIAATVSVHRRLARRVQEARSALTDGDVARAHAGDELDTIVDEAGHAGRALRTEVERLERLADYRRSFLGDVSHELRTPIFAISGFAESLLDGALDDPEVRERFVQKILANARRLDALARDLAEIARIESGELRMRTAAFDLGALARETIETLETLATERGIDVAVIAPADLPRVVGDRGRLQQVLANLVENALKYTERGGRVELSAAATPAGVRVAVSDNGIGIAPEDVARVTERFFRVDRSRSRTEGGTGLGLSIVKHILEAHGVPLDVTSRPGEGSTFAFTLPADRPRSAGTAFEARQVSTAPPITR
jgi:two-component system phosphate regulon sensor histidine kinase PhoR